MGAGLVEKDARISWPALIRRRQTGNRVCMGPLAAWIRDRCGCIPIAQTFRSAFPCMGVRLLSDGLVLGGVPGALEVRGAGIKSDVAFGCLRTPLHWSMEAQNSSRAAHSQVGNNHHSDSAFASRRHQLCLQLKPETLVHYS